jgi:aryl-alcohol dehydrogenase-like predicted oxidoreductase
MDKFIRRFAIGTVQFGLDYGINNLRGKVPEDEVLSILQFAFINGISTIDSAYAYGESERIIGHILEAHPELEFSIISKFPKCNDIKSLKEFINGSINNLKSPCIYGYLAHDTDSVINNPSLWDELLKLKENKVFRNIGISVYYTHQIEWFLERNMPFDIVQLPYNIFDNRFPYLFGELKKRNIEIHIRSVFLQGLVFKSTDSLPDHFNSIKDRINKLKKISNNFNIPLNSLLLCYVLLNLEIDKIVIGIDCIENLKENINAVNLIDKVEAIYEILSEFSIDDEKILLPFNWIKS